MASDIDIDHMVPLKNAWIVSQPSSKLVLPLLDSFRRRHVTVSSGDHELTLVIAQSGASSWTTAKREQFANDLSRPQLWAVTDKINSAKGDKSPDLWKPPLSTFYCTYAKSWVSVKSYYELTVTSAEKTALAIMLSTC